jgi:hypothetical protein
VLSAQRLALRGPLTGEARDLAPLNCCEQLVRQVQKLLSRCNELS